MIQPDNPTNMTLPDPQINKTTLRIQQTQAWLSQPQTYLAGFKAQSEQSGKEKGSALEKHLRSLGLQAEATGKQKGGAEINRTMEHASGQAHLLQVGAWARS